jgi:hypothetical protein
MTKPGSISRSGRNLGRRDILRLAGVAALAAVASTAAFAQTGKLGAAREGGSLGTQLAKAGYLVMFSCGTCTGCAPAPSSARSR